LAEAFLQVWNYFWTALLFEPIRFSKFMPCFVRVKGGPCFTLVFGPD
jgi:hypothetical protein